MAIDGGGRGGKVWIPGRTMGRLVAMESDGIGPTRRGVALGGRAVCRVFLLGLGIGSVWGQDEVDDFGVVGRLDGRIEAAAQRMREIEAELSRCPGLPVDDQGGSGGAASLHPPGTRESVMTIRWDQPAAVDFIALVPARRYEIDGLNPQYGLPDAFRIEWLDSRGEVGGVVARFDGVRKTRLRRGHPIVVELGEAVMAAGLRVVATRLPLDGERFVHAWAEWFIEGPAFRLPRDGCRVEISGQPSLAPWQWAPRFLIDGQTPLGLPEMPGPPHRDVGWLSRGVERADRRIWLEVDLGRETEFDRVRLMPAKRPTPDLPSGFGFPRAIELRTVDAGRQVAGGEPLARWSGRNPGHNPVEIACGPVRARRLRLKATELWKPYESYPAFFALSEVELWQGGTKVSDGATARSPDGMGGVIAAGARLWNTASVCDGFGPEGRLVPEREWLLALDRRLRLEVEHDELGRLQREIRAVWRGRALGVLGVLGGGGLLALLVLPLRYRLRERRQLREVRERIAGDLHDEVGSNLGSIQMLADLVEGSTGPSRELGRIQRIAAETVSAVRDIVWLLRPDGRARIGTAEHLRETASIMLERLDWHFTANEAAWQTSLTDDQNRHVFLFFREALHNILRHSQARVVRIRCEDEAGVLRLEIEDDGVGIPATKRERPSTLRALRQRAEALAASFEWDSTAPGGTVLRLAIPLGGKRRG